MATKINSSLVPEQRDLPDNAVGENIVHIPIPENLQWPQWVANSWQEYSADNDPMVIKSRELEASYLTVQTPAT